MKKLLGIIVENKYIHVYGLQIIFECNNKIQPQVIVAALGRN